MATVKDLKRELVVLCKYRRISPPLEVSEAWEIVEGFVSGGSVPHYDHPGCYALFTADGELQYLGKATRLGNRLARYWSRKDGSARHKMAAPYTSLRTIKTKTKEDAKQLEADLIGALKPPCNKRRERIKP